MSLALISLLALLAAIVIGTFTQANVGMLAIALAFAIGVSVGGLSVKQVGAGFPVSLFLTLVAVTFLFAQARVNGTLERVASAATYLAFGKPGVIPLVFFALALVFATVGPGNIAATALLAPVAMAAAHRAGVPAFLMAIMVCNGANAGAFSPLAPTGIIANGLMAKMGLQGFEWTNYFNALIPQTLVGLGGGDPLAIAASINVGAHLVDVSPLSTLGALTIAAAAPEEDRKALFNKMLAWGLSMSVVGALVCYVMFGIL